MEGLVIVLFTDVEGSTELSTRRGDAAARDLLRIHEELVRAQVAGHQGRVSGMRGDGFLVTFTSARRALACAVGIQRALEEHAARAPHEHVRVRVGLNAGDVAEEHGELYGAAVNAAARICAEAGAGEVLVASVVRELAGTVPGISFVSRGRVRLRGFPEDTHLYEVTWQRETPAGSRPQRTPLAGRGAEMARLHQLAEGALSGHGALVMLAGEPGAGKSRLAEEIAGIAARRGMLALTGHCDEAAGAPPHAPFVEIIEGTMRTVPGERLRAALGDDAAEVAKIAPDLHRLFSDIPPCATLPAEHERRYLFTSVCGFVERVSRLRPLLLVLDDLHWADEATLALLRHLAERVRDMPILLIGTYRDVEVGVGHPLADTLEVLVRRHRCHQIAVRRLPEVQVAAMIRSITGQDPAPPIVAAIHDETEGNPFFVEEMVRYLIDEGRLMDAEGRLRPDLAIGDLDVPDPVRLVIGRRLARLGDATRRLLTAAAVIGRGFGVGLLEAMSEVDGEAWLDAIDEAERSHLIIPGDGGGTAGYRFAHELIRQTLVADTSLPRRQRLHLQVAEAMQGTETRDLLTQAVEIAHHLVEAGALADGPRTVRYLTLAADRAMAVAAFEEALDHVRAALDRVPDGDPQGRATLLEKLALALRGLGRWDAALEAWSQAVAAQEEVDDGEGEAVGRLCAEMGNHLAWGAHAGECLEVVARGLRALGERRSPWRVRLLALAGVAVSFSGDHDAGDTLTRQAVDLGEEFGATVLGDALLGRCSHHWFWGELREAVTAGTRGVEIVRSAGSLWHLSNGASHLRIALVVLGRVDDAARIAESLHPIASRLGQQGATQLTGYASAFLPAMAGDIAGFERAALDHLAACRATGGAWASEVHVRLGAAAFWRGRWDRAAAEFEEAARREPPGSAFEGRGWAFGLMVRAYRGDRQGVLATLAERRSSLPRPGQPHNLAAWSILLALPEALAVVGARSEVAALRPLVREAVRTGAVLRLSDAALVPSIAGMCAAADGDWAEAEEHYRDALRLAERLPHRIAQPEVRRWLGEMLLLRDAPGDRDEARVLLGEAVEGYRRLGMPRHLELAEVLLGEAERATRP